jgi:2-dehydro-3-deoxyphosphogluconate aldolase / (4S)-4-hydroxy-2-oxoglutarate aldolase
VNSLTRACVRLSLVTRDEVRARICGLGIVPAIRVTSAEDALFAAESVARGGIPIVEVTTTVPGAMAVIREIRRAHPDIVVGAGTVLDAETAECFVAAGAHFLTSPGLHLPVMEVAASHNTVVMPGALTPTEICAASKAGADFVKVFPCAPVGGPSYIRSMRGPFPEIPFMAGGGVNQQTAAEYILAGAAALGIGGDLIPRTAIRERNRDWINELSHRFLGIIKAARSRLAKAAY